MKLLPPIFFTEGNDNRSHVNIGTTMPDGLERKSFYHLFSQMGPFRKHNVLSGMMLLQGCERENVKVKVPFTDHFNKNHLIQCTIFYW
jgi:hypothetical protein